MKYKASISVVIETDQELPEGIKFGDEETMASFISNLPAAGIKNVPIFRLEIVKERED